MSYAFGSLQWLNWEFASTFVAFDKFGEYIVYFNTELDFDYHDAGAGVSILPVEKGYPY